jgi:hypothetical protein
MTRGDRAADGLLGDSGMRHQERRDQKSGVRDEGGGSQQRSAPVGRRYVTQ